MLVDIRSDLDPDCLTAVKGFQNRYTRLARGVYAPGTSAGAHNEFRGIVKNASPFQPLYDSTLTADEWMDRVVKFLQEDHPREYGVCDHWEQITAKWPQIESSERQFIIAVQEIRREHQGPGGWRWHKAGEYIGTRNPEREYLHDEPEIDAVLSFVILEIYDWAAEHPDNRTP